MDSKPVSVPRHIKTFRTLPRVIGISVSTLSDYKKLPGWPGKGSKGYDLEAVNHHIHEASKNRSATSGAGQSEFLFARVDGDMGDLKKWQVYEHARKAKLANDLKQGKLLDRKAVEETINRMVAECQSVLVSLPARLAPQVVGMQVAEAEELIKHGIGEAIRRLREGR